MQKRLSGKKWIEKLNERNSYVNSLKKKKKREKEVTAY